MRLKNLVSPLVIAFIALFAFACESLDFGDFDVNNNNMIEKSEFRTYFIDNYSGDLKRTSDMGWDDESFYTTTYIVLDRDRNDQLIKDEWMHGYDYYYGDYLTNDFIVYDLNHDGYLSRSEYLDALTPTTYFVTWDVDQNKYLSDMEFADAVFANWDTDDNGTLDKAEFDRFDRAYTDI